MMKNRFALILTLLLALVLIAACAREAPTEEPAPAPEESTGPALQITGRVDNEMSWSEEEVRAMDTIEAESTNKDGETSTYTGVPLTTLLDMAGVQDGATSLVFVADDDYEAEVALEEALACSDCIVSFRNKGGFSMVMPGFSGKAQVKGVIEIKVQ